MSDHAAITVQVAAAVQLAAVEDVIEAYAALRKRITRRTGITPHAEGDDGVSRGIPGPHFSDQTNMLRAHNDRFVYG